MSDGTKLFRLHAEKQKIRGEVSLSKVVVRSLRARVGLVAALAALLVLTAGAGVFAQQTVVIGTLGPLTGDYASYGVSVANGVELAVNERSEERRGGEECNRHVKLQR